MIASLPQWLRSGRGREVVALLPLLALVVGWALIAQPAGHPVRDEISLLRLAHRLLHGEYAEASGALGPRAFLWHGPGEPVYLAPFVALGLPLELLRVVSALPLWGAFVGFHALLRRRLARRPALLWTYALAAYLPFYAFSRQIQKEPLALLLVVVAMLATSDALARRRARPAILAGLALAGLVMVRLEYG